MKIKKVIARSNKNLLIKSILTASLSLFSGVALGGPGFPNVPQTKGELLSGPFGTKGGRAATVFYQDGYIGSVFESPASAPGSDGTSRIYDISNLRDPKEFTFSSGPNSMVDAHGFIFEEGVIRIKGDWKFDNNQGKNSNAPQFFWPGGASGRGIIFQPFSFSGWWPEYGKTTARTASVFKYGKSLCTFNTAVNAHPILIGNILFYASDTTKQGIAAYDLTPCLNNGSPPRELGTIGQKIGGYWAAAFGGNNKLYIANVEDFESKQVSIVDVTDPSNMKLVKSFDIPPLNTSGPMYPKMHNNSMFFYNKKVDMSTFALEQYIDNRAKQIDVSQFLLPMGNLMVTGGIYHNAPNRQGLAIWAIQSEPDTEGPFVGYHIPRPNQTNYPAGAPVTLLIHETLQSDTITNQKNFTVKKITADGSAGSALAGRLPFTFDGILTFTPSTDFEANSTYEVELVSGGIKDAAGNGAVGYKFRFSTGSNVIGGITQPTPQNTPISVPTPVVLNTIAPIKTPVAVNTPILVNTIAPVKTITIVNTPAPVNTPVVATPITIPTTVPASTNNNTTVGNLTSFQQLLQQLIQFLMLYITFLDSNNNNGQITVLKNLRSLTDTAINLNKSKRFRMLRNVSAVKSARTDMLKIKKIISIDDTGKLNKTLLRKEALSLRKNLNVKLLLIKNLLKTERSNKGKSKLLR